MKHNVMKLDTIVLKGMYNAPLRLTGLHVTAMPYVHVFGASCSEPHTSKLNSAFLCIMCIHVCVRPSAFYRSWAINKEMHTFTHTSAHSIHKCILIVSATILRR